MPNIKSAAKRVRQAEKRRLRNKAIKTRTKTEIKKFLKAVEEKDVNKAEELLNNAIKYIYKAKSKGVLHWRNAARKVSRLSIRLNKLKAEVSENNA